MADKLVTIVGNWALGADEIQWILMERHPRKERPDTWDGVSFIRSTKDILARCMREKGVEPGTADLLLAGLPGHLR